ncbi:unnamed protein product [Pedinophyceae sp. YPF-701]|nr:unnamed protein product [Pedinophyceae sp. YPF-701]
MDSDDERTDLTHGTGLPQPWELLVRPAGAEEPQDASFTLEDEQLTEQIEALMPNILILDSSTSSMPIVFASKGVEQLTGYTSLDLVGEQLSVLRGAKTEQAVAKELDDGIAAQEVVAVDITLHKKNKQQFRCLTVAVPALQSDGSPLRLMVVLQDVSDKRRNETGIERVREMCTTLMKSFMLVDAASHACPIQNVSGGFSEMTQFSNSDVLGLSCLCPGGPTTDKGAMEQLVTSMRKGRPTSTTMLCHRRNGEPFWALVFSFPHQPASREKQLMAPLGGSQKMQLVLMVEVTQTKQRKVGKYVLGQVLGKGAFGVVCVGRDTQTSDLVAIKMINGSNFKSIQEIENVQDEMRVLSSLKHENIVQLLDVQYVGNCIYFIMEYASGGALHSYMWAKEDHKCTEEEARTMIRQMVAALDYCHRRRIIHRDLKPENILLDADCNVKVADFGLAAITSPFSQNLGQSVGTPEFAAPEIVNGKEYDGPTVDIWSLGVILYEMTVGSLPFKGGNMRELFKKISKGEYDPMPSKLSKELKDLVAKMLTVDSAKRATLREIKKHPWVWQAGDEEEEIARGMDGVGVDDGGRQVGRSSSRVFSDAVHSSLNLVIPTAEGPTRKPRRDDDDLERDADGKGRAGAGAGKAGGAPGADSKKKGLVAGRGAEQAGITSGPASTKKTGVRPSSDAKTPPKKTGLLNKYGAGESGGGGSTSAKKPAAKTAQRKPLV